MLLLLLNLAATGTLIGLGWAQRLLHTPLLDRVGAEAWPGYAAADLARTRLLFTPWMLLELGTSVGLAFGPPAPVPAWGGWLGAGLAVAICGITWLVLDARGRALAAGFDAAGHRALLAGQSLRMALWTARGVLTLWMFWLVSTLT